jgi:ABC transport system ATP-binding/permease protein
MALISLRDVRIGFGGPLVLEGVNLQVERGERLGLLGFNGSGKSTLLKVISGELPPNEGQVVRQAGLRVAYLPQEVPDDLTGTIGDVIAAGFGPLTAAAHDDRRAHDDDSALEEQVWQRRRQLDTILLRMQLDPALDFASLSAGYKRRVLLARGLVADPDLVLLDEPTNHLDIDAITWLEDFLQRYRGTLVFVTHDRAFLRKLTTRIVELDRGSLNDWSCDYTVYLQRRQAVLDAEASQAFEFDRKLAQEEVWIRQGIEARRTRNEGRVRALERLREERGARRETGNLRIRIQDAERSGRLVLKVDGLTFGYGERVVVDGFSTVVMRGDKIGIVGPNGSGKTTLLRLLVGDLTPEHGKVRRGTNLSVAYFDQLRGQIRDDWTVFDNVADGADYVMVNGKRRHVIGYLQDFLFPPARTRVYAGVLSGGERNRLLLARLFAKPANLLVLDEPTNDLDLETLELLEDLLLEYEGTLVLVSHDRELLNNVATSTLAVEGQGRVAEYVGGYDDWVRQRQGPRASGPGEPRGGPLPSADRSAGRSARANGAAATDERPRKLTYKEQRELDALPGQIEALEGEQAELYRRMAAPDTYQAGGDEVVQAAARLAAVETQLAETYARWEELEGLAGS